MAVLQWVFILTFLKSVYSQELPLSGANVIALISNTNDNLLPVRFYNGFQRNDIPNGGSISRGYQANLDLCLRICVNDNGVILPDASDLDCNAVDFWAAAPVNTPNCFNHLDLSCSTATALYTAAPGWTHYKMVHLCDETRLVKSAGQVSVDPTSLPTGVSTSAQPTPTNAADCGLLCNVRVNCIAADFSAFTSCRHFDTVTPSFGDCLSTVTQTGATTYMLPCNLAPFRGIKNGLVPNAIARAATADNFFQCREKCVNDPDCIGYQYNTVAEFLFPRPFCALYDENTVATSISCQPAIQQRNVFTVHKFPCRFTRENNTMKVGGIPQPLWRTLYECERECHYDSTCTGYDWNKLQTTPSRDRCMFHTEDSGGCENSLNNTCCNHYEHIDFRCSMTITGVRPTVGPQSGGTLITITGTFMSNYGPVTIGGIPCLLKERTTEDYVCLSGLLMDATKLNMPLEVIVHVSNTAASIPSGFQFSYQTDPVILKIEPLISIESGGALLTVTGQNLDIVETTIMVTTVRSLITFKQYSEETNCIVKSSSKMECPTPKINLDRLARRRRRRQATTSINVRENIEVEISFRLDGVLEYKNLSVGDLSEYSRITIYTDPVIDKFSPSVLVFTSTWPVQERQLEITGATLLKGLRQNAYVVSIGDALCGNIVVEDNLITCEPPRTRPQVPDGDYIGANKIPVKLLFARQVVILGHLEYVQNVWEYSPSRYGFIAALCVIAVIIVIIIIVCLCKRRPPTHDNLAARGVPVRREKLEMKERVRR